MVVLYTGVQKENTDGTAREADMSTGDVRLN